MVIWAVWLLVAVTVLGAKYYTTKAISEMRFHLSQHMKHLTCLRTEERGIQNTIAILKRNLSLVQKGMADGKKLIPKLKQDIMAMEEEKKNKVQESKTLIAQANPFGRS